MIKPGDGAQGGRRGTPVLEATCLECRVNSNRRLATVFQSWTWRMGFLPKEARGLGIRLHLKLVCGRESEDRGYAGDARPRVPRPGVVADVWERASGREWEQQGRRGLGTLNLQGPRAGRDREPGQPGMPWPHVPNETAYGLMKAVSRVEKNGKRKATLKEKKRSACAGELLREQTERKQRHSRSHTRLAHEAECTQTSPSATPRGWVSPTHAS